MKKNFSFYLLILLFILVAAGVILEFSTPGKSGDGTPSKAEGVDLQELRQPSPDGEYTAHVIASDAGMNGSEVLLSREGAKDVQVVASGDNSSWVTNPIWSPDGRTVAYLRVINTQVSEFEIDSSYELWVYDVKNGENRLVTDSAALNPAISFDGTADIKWLSDTLIQYPNNEAFPIQYYTVNVQTLETTAEVSKSLPKTANSASLPGEVPYYSQCDSRWGSQILGACSQYTICQQGCAISSTAMIFKYFGISTNPAGMNTWLKSNNGYYAGCLINWATAANLAPGKLTWVARVNSQDWSRLRYELDSGYPVILEVRINGGQHFVVATGYYGDTYYINDPYYSSRTTLASYGNSFVGLRIYHGPTSEPASCPASTDTKTFVCTPHLTPTYNDNACSSLWYPIRGFNGNTTYLVENAQSASTSTNLGSWTPDLPRAGKYKVEAFIAAHGTFSKVCSAATLTFGADSSKAKYVITSKGGTQTEVIRDQLPLNDEWLNLGEYFFSAGSNGSVTLSDLTGETESSRNVSFGAMRFTYVGPAEYPLPAITSLSLSIKPAGAKDFVLTINGSGFYPESVVRWNGSDRTTTYVNKTQLTAAITAADVSTTGTAVVTVFNQEHGGGVSNPVNFSIIHISPERKELLTTSKVTFDWDDIIDAELYKIQLSEKQDFSTLVFSIKTTDSTYAYDTFLKYSTTYYWRIRAKVGDIWGTWSPTWKITSMDPLTAPPLLSPDHKQTFTTNTVTLSWNSVLNGYQYKVQVSQYSDFSTKLVNENLDPDVLTRKLSNLKDGKYYWRVRAIDASGGKGPWSAVRIFKVVTP